MSTNRRPFHETIVEAIGGCEQSIELMVLARLIKATKIPSGFEVISQAWSERVRTLDLATDFGVIDDVNGRKDEQKASELAAQKEAAISMT